MHRPAAPPSLRNTGARMLALMLVLTAPATGAARATDDGPLPDDGQPSLDEVIGRDDDGPGTDGHRADDDDAPGDEVGRLAAAPRRKRTARRPRPAPAGPIEIPVEIGAGPIALVPSPPALFDQPVHLGLQIDLAAIISQDLIRRYQSRIPSQYRSTAASVDEVRFRPGWLVLVPEVLVISPAVLNTGLYGAIWRPFGLSIPFIDTPAFDLKAGADITAVALFAHSSTLGVPAGTTGQSLTFVLRPGLHLHVTADLPLSDSLRLRGGWSSDFFVPQPWGRPPWELFPLEDSLWHLGGPFLMLAYRFPYTVAGL